jgi:hypothetical protein
MRRFREMHAPGGMDGDELLDFLSGMARRLKAPRSCNNVEQVTIKRPLNPGRLSSACAARFCRRPPASQRPTNL